MNVKIACTIVALLSLNACAIHQVVKPVEKLSDKQICIVDNPAVKSTFFDAYRNALSAKGYVVKQLPAGSSLIECQVTSTYTANWKWDLAMYMSFADITVYHNAKPAGKATYDSTRGGGNMNKFIDANKKIIELVDQLFPGGPNL
jgi:hypothetical protein